MRITYSQYFLVCWEVKLSDIFFFLEMTIICNNFITCACELSAPFFCNLQSWARTHVVFVIGLYELLGNPTT
jgi:hypothetical protein